MNGQPSSVGSQARTFFEDMCSMKPEKQNRSLVGPLLKASASSVLTSGPWPLSEQAEIAGISRRKAS